MFADGLQQTTMIVFESLTFSISWFASPLVNDNFAPLVCQRLGPVPVRKQPWSMLLLRPVLGCKLVDNGSYFLLQMDRRHGHN